MKRLEIEYLCTEGEIKKNLGWIRNAGEKKKSRRELSVKSDFQHHNSKLTFLWVYSLESKWTNIPSRWFLDIYLSASSRRMTGMEIFSTTIHWDQCRGVTWKINCRTEKASELQHVAMTPEHTANPAEWENINTHGQTKPNQRRECAANTENATIYRNSAVAQQS